MLLVDQPTGPYPHVLISAGKSGTIYVVNRDNMGHYNPSNDNQIVQVSSLVSCRTETRDRQFQHAGLLQRLCLLWRRERHAEGISVQQRVAVDGADFPIAAIYPIRGGSFAISANGNTNGILWALQNNGRAPDNDTGAPGVLFAYDATNLANELYDSSQAGTRDTLDLAAKFSIPLVANGKVFVSGQTQLIVYGLLP